MQAAETRVVSQKRRQTKNTITFTLFPIFHILTVDILHSRPDSQVVVSFMCLVAVWQA